MKAFTFTRSGLVEGIALTRREFESANLTKEGSRTRKDYYGCLYLGSEEAGATLFRLTSQERDFEGTLLEVGAQWVPGDGPQLTKGELSKSSHCLVYIPAMPSFAGDTIIEIGEVVDVEDGMPVFNYTQLQPPVFEVPVQNRDEEGNVTISTVKHVAGTTQEACRAWRRLTTAPMVNGTIILAVATGPRRSRHKRDMEYALLIPNAGALRLRRTGRLPDDVQSSFDYQWVGGEWEELELE